MTVLTWMPDILADEFRGVKGFQVDVLSGWRTRSAKTTTYRPVGVLNHHTGAGGYAALLAYMSEGSAIAPLCQVASSRPSNGIVRITIVAAGRANHAGVGHLPEVGTNGGNLHLIGNEHQNDGRQAWPAQQVEAIHRMTAAQLRHLRKNERWAWDHKDYAPGRKVDRHTVVLSRERAAIRAFLTPPTPPPVEPKPPLPPDDKMKEMLMKTVVCGVASNADGNGGTNGKPQAVGHPTDSSGRNTRFILEPARTGPGYAFRIVPSPAAALVLTGDAKWRDNTVWFTPDQARQVPVVW